MHLYFKQQRLQGEKEEDALTEMHNFQEPQVRLHVFLVSHLLKPVLRLGAWDLWWVYYVPGLIIRLMNYQNMDDKFLLWFFLLVWYCGSRPCLSHTWPTYMRFSFILLVYIRVVPPHIIYPTPLLYHRHLLHVYLDIVNIITVPVGLDSRFHKPKSAPMTRPRVAAAPPADCNIGPGSDLFLRIEISRGLFRNADGE